MTYFNVIVSGISVSGDVDTSQSPVRIEMGNSDKIGHAEFSLSNKLGAYSRITVSGNAICQIDAVPSSGVTVTLFRGTIESNDPSVSVGAGSVATISAFDFGQEFLGLVSPDARLPSLLNADGTMNIASGDQGISSNEGMFLAYTVSGVTPSSGATLSSFMAQFFGRSGDFSGSFSGAVFSFKPHISGYTWRTWYYPDASGGVITSDSNLNYWIPLEALKVKRDDAWNVLRKITRQGAVIDRGGNRVQFESYIGVSGDLHVFTSGSYEFVVSGVTLVYYEIGNSGSDLNNILFARNPFDTTYVKNYILGWFPPQTKYPFDQDLFTDFVAYSGNYWSGLGTGAGIGSGILSGNAAAGTIGRMSIQCGAVNVGANRQGAIARYTHFSGLSFNLRRYNISGLGTAVTLNYNMRFSTSGADDTTARRIAKIYDTSGDFIWISGTTGSETLVVREEWHPYTHTIYKGNGAFNSGSGTDGGWASSGTSTNFPDLTRVKQIEIGFLADSPGLPVSGAAEVRIDNLYFSFSYPFSPIVAINSGSQGMGYGRRYSIMEYPYEVDIGQASGIVTHELNARMGNRGVAEVVVKDNPRQEISAQLNIKPGQVVVMDAPTLNTGSGQTFFYWKALDVTHEWSHAQGFITRLKMIPWFSGTIVEPNSNLVDYQVPLTYADPEPQPAQTRPMWLPTLVKWWRDW